MKRRHWSVVWTLMAGAGMTALGGCEVASSEGAIEGSERGPESHGVEICDMPPPASGQACGFVASGDPIECPGGEVCVDVPAPFFPGADPQMCAAALSCAGTCYADGDCAEGQRCVGAEPPTTQGACREDLPAAACWEAEDCPDGSVIGFDAWEPTGQGAWCEGLVSCSPFDPGCEPVPGQCRARSAQKQFLWSTPRSVYVMDGGYLPRWFNLSGDPVRVQPGCAFRVEYSVDNGPWEIVYEPVCDDEPIEIAPGTAWRAKRFTVPYEIVNAYFEVTQGEQEIRVKLTGRGLDGESPSLVIVTSWIF